MIRFSTYKNRSIKKLRYIKIQQENMFHVGSLISFVKHEEAIEVVAGSFAQIMCRTKLPVRECQWSWRRLNQSEPWNLEVKKFPAFGNDSTDCSIKFKNVLAEQEGYWSCGARIDPNSSFVRSNPVRFLISEGMRKCNSLGNLILFLHYIFFTSLTRVTF